MEPSAITTNVPARVYIDGERVNRRTPLSRFPIKAGTRLIRLVSTTTGETQESELRFTRGQHRKLVVDSFKCGPTAPAAAGSTPHTAGSASSSGASRTWLA